MSSTAFSSTGSTLGKVTGVLAPTNPYGIGTSAYNAVQAPKIPTSPAPTTAVKTQSVTYPTGHTVDTSYHPPAQLAPDDPSNKYNTATGQLNPNYKDPNAPIVSQQTQAGMINSNTGVNANNSTTYPQYSPPNQGTTGVSQGGLIGNAVGQSQTPNPIAQTAGTNLNNLGLGGQNSPEVEAAIKELEDLQKQYATNTRNIAGTAGFLTQQNGEQGIQNQQYSTLLSAAQNRLQNALSAQGQRITASTNAGGIGNSIQGLQQGALGTAIGANNPVFGVGYGTQVGNPSAPGGGINTSLNGVQTPANISSIQDFVTKINTINGQKDAVDNNFSRAVNYATSAGLPNDSAILAGITAKIKAGLLPNTSLAGFNQVVGQLNQQATALGFTPIDANNITPNQLKQLQIAVQQKLKNDLSNYESEKQKLLNGGTSSSSSGGSTEGNMFGSFF